MANEPNKHRSSVGHDGRSRAFAKAGERTLAIHHDPNIARQGDLPDATAHERHGHRGHPVGAVVAGKTVRAPGALDIQPRSGAPKALHPVSLHNSTTPRQIAGMNAGGMAHPTALVDGGQTIADSAVASPTHATPLAAGALPKSRQDVGVAFGNRHRNSDQPHGGGVGENIVRDGNPNDRHAMNRELGKRILAEATASPDDMQALAHYGVGTLRSK
jgi:hypothetical protein